MCNTPRWLGCGHLSCLVCSLLGNLLSLSRHVALRRLSYWTTNSFSIVFKWTYPSKYGSCSRSFPSWSCRCRICHSNQNFPSGDAYRTSSITNIEGSHWTVRTYAVTCLQTLQGCRISPIVGTPDQVRVSCLVPWEMLHPMFPHMPQTISMAALREHNADSLTDCGILVSNDTGQGSFEHASPKLGKQPNKSFVVSSSSKAPANKLDCKWWLTPVNSAKVILNLLVL